jgi:CheY-like chemotaxis protein
MAIRNPRVLIVEDNAAYLYLIQKAFSLRTESARWECITAEDGAQALHFLFEEEEEHAPLPDLILLDWNLPKVSGRQVLQRMKQDENLRRIPVLVFSASDAVEDIDVAYGAHANGYITKPAGDVSLIDIIATIEDFWVTVARLSKVTRPV